MAEPGRPRWDRRLAARLPITASIRFRLTLVYSVMLFGLAAIVVGGIYAGLSRSLDDEPLSRTEQAVAIFRHPDGTSVLGIVDVEVPDYLARFEREVNTRALDQLRTYAFGALGLLFVGSLGVGWFAAGIVVRPVDRITAVAREIQATDLSRRIRLEGADDELKRLADTFDEMLARLDDAFESQRRFIHEASHELRNPLAVIRTNVDVVLGDPDAGDEELRQAGEVVARSAERMTTLVDDLLAYARLGQRPTREETFDLGAVVDDLGAEFAAPAETRGLELEVRRPPGELRICGDAPAVRRAVANLLANAVRLAPAGTRVTIAAGRRDAWAWVSVTDEGPGIDPHDHDRVFQRFWRSPAAGDDRHRSGLGLAIVRQIAEAHGGRVELDSAPGRGSTFVVWLPVGEGSGATPTRPPLSASFDEDA